MEPTLLPAHSVGTWQEMCGALRVDATSLEHEKEMGGSALGELEKDRCLMRCAFV